MADGDPAPETRQAREETGRALAARVGRAHSFVSMCGLIDSGVAMGGGCMDGYACLPALLEPHFSGASGGLSNLYLLACGFHYYLWCSKSYGLIFDS